jgi:hypothetical protein
MLDDLTESDGLSPIKSLIAHDATCCAPEAGELTVC